MKKNRVSLFLLISAAFLLFMYVLSFTELVNPKDSRKKIQTALLNPKNVSKIYKIELSTGDTLLQFNKTNDFWSISDSINSSAGVPADTVKINDFLAELSGIRFMYITSKKADKKYRENFGLTDGSQFKIKYYYDENSSEELIFGNQDFSQTSRYMMTGNNFQVFEIDDSLDKFLSTSVQVWSDPMIISQFVMSKISSGDIQTIETEYDEDNQIKLKKISSLKIADWNDRISKLLELRHGGICNESDIEINNAIKTKIELGNKAFIIIDIGKLADDEGYKVECSYYSDRNKLIYKSSEKISAWTYNKIKEIIL